jgi:hypothetical protein
VFAVFEVFFLRYTRESLGLFEEIRARSDRKKAADTANTARLRPWVALGGPPAPSRRDLPRDARINTKKGVPTP